MMHGCDVVRLRQRVALRVGDRYHRNVGEDFVDALQLGQIEPAVQGRHERHPHPAQHRITQIIDVKMDNVEFLGPARQHFQHNDVRRQIIPHCPIEAQRAAAHRLQPGFGDAVAGGEQGNIVTEGGELVGEVGDDALGAAIELGRHRFHQWRNLCDLHGDPGEGARTEASQRRPSQRDARAVARPGPTLVP